MTTKRNSAIEEYGVEKIEAFLLDRLKELSEGNDHYFTLKTMQRPLLNALFYEEELPLGKAKKIITRTNLTGILENNPKVETIKVYRGSRDYLTAYRINEGGKRK